MFTLYGMPSPNVRKVGIMLEELGVDYTLSHVAVFKGEQFDAAFQAISPFAKVPVLVDAATGEATFESGAILFYLAERFGRFLPAEGQARYDVMQWLMAQMALVGPMLGQLNHFQLVGEADHPYAFARYRNQAYTAYRRMDERLAKAEWLGGADYSIADIATFPWMLYLEQHGGEPDDYPAMIAWRDRIAARPAVQRQFARFRESFDLETDRSRRTATAPDLDRFFNRASDAPPADFSAVTR